MVRSGGSVFLLGQLCSAPWVHLLRRAGLGPQEQKFVKGYQRNLIQLAQKGIFGCFPWDISICEPGQSLGMQGCSSLRRDIQASCRETAEFEILIRMGNIPH